MTLFHFVNCCLLSFGPHFIYYKATPLSEYGIWTASANAAAVYVVATLLKMMLWASVLKVSEEEGASLHFDTYQEAAKAAIGFLVDWIALYYAVVHIVLRNISNSHKVQAIGLGWATAETLTRRLLPLWVGAGAMDFSWEFLLDSVTSNADLLLALSLAALASLVWQRRSKPLALVPLIYLAVAAASSVPFFSSYLQRVQLWSLTSATGFHVGSSVACALVTMWLYHSCTS